MSRTSKSIRNVFVAIIGRIILMLIGFFARKLFILFLSVEYLGLNGLFSSVLTVLSIMELGLGPAMIFSLYKPLAENNISVCQALMAVYRKAYHAIGFAVLIIGCSITPFITRLIKEIPDNIYGIHIIYVMFVVNAAVSYFFSYKRSLIIASQNQYIIQSIHIVAYLILNLLQILILAFTKNYFLYLGLQIISTFCENYLLSKHAEKSFPWILEKKEYKLPEDKKSEVLRNIKAMVFHKIGGIVLDATDNLLISKFFGLSFLGFYSNYVLIINAVKSFIQSPFSSITASIGDFGVSKTPEESYKLYKKVQFINFWLTAFSTISIFILINPFISLIWLNDNYLITFPILVVVVLNFYIDGMRKTILTFKEAYGLPWYDRYKPLIGAAVNLFFSIWLQSFMGVIGIFWGTTITQLLVNVWFEAFVVFKFVFHKKLTFFFAEYFLQNLMFLGILAVTYGICSLLPSTSIISFIIYVGVCVVVPNGLISLFYHNTNEYKFFWGLIYTYIRRKKDISKFT